MKSRQAKNRINTWCKKTNDRYVIIYPYTLCPKAFNIICCCKVTTCESQLKEKGKLFYANLMKICLNGNLKNVQKICTDVNMILKDEYT